MLTWAVSLSQLGWHYPALHPLGRGSCSELFRPIHSQGFQIVRKGTQRKTTWTLLQYRDTAIWRAADIEMLTPASLRITRFNFGGAFQIRFNLVFIPRLYKFKVSVFISPKGPTSVDRPQYSRKGLYLDVLSRRQAYQSFSDDPRSDEGQERAKTRSAELAQLEFPLGVL